MILESLLTDDTIVTFDCAQARLGKGQKIDVKDKFWHDPEIQGAIKLGMVRVVGENPNTPKPEDNRPDPASESKKKFISTSESRIAFECDTKFKDDQTGDPVKWKDYVDKGGVLWVPESSVQSRAIQNALAYGLLVDPDAKESESRGPSTPVDLSETTISSQNTKQRPRRTMSSELKAKPISSAGNSNGIEDDADDNSMFKPSAVIDAQELKPQTKSVVEITESNDGIDFLDLSIVAKDAPTKKSNKSEELNETTNPEDLGEDFGGSFQDLFGFEMDQDGDSKGGSDSDQDAEDF